MDKDLDEYIKEVEELRKSLRSNLSDEDIHISNHNLENGQIEIIINSKDEILKGSLIYGDSIVITSFSKDSHYLIDKLNSLYLDLSSLVESYEFDFEESRKRKNIDIEKLYLEEFNSVFGKFKDLEEREDY